MKIGICTSIDKLEEAKSIGFDYAELNLSALAGLADDAFADSCKSIQAAGLPVEAMNILFPGTIKLVGPEADLAVTRTYLDKAFARAKAVGACVIVFGSGRARMIPEGHDRKAAMAQLAAATACIGEAAAAHGLTVVVEPLNTGETNVINSVAEGDALRKQAAMPSISLLADYYHMAVEKEPLDNIISAGSLAHAHIARGIGRTYPLSREEDDYNGFFRALAKINYIGRMSIEGGTNDFAQDAPAALAFLRMLAAENGL